MKLNQTKKERLVIFSIMFGSLSIHVLYSKLQRKLDHNPTTSDSTFHGNCDRDRNKPSISSSQANSQHFLFTTCGCRVTLGVITTCVLYRIKDDSMQCGHYTLPMHHMMADMIIVQVQITNYTGHRNSEFVHCLFHHAQKEQQRNNVDKCSHFISLVILSLITADQIKQKCSYINTECLPLVGTWTDCRDCLLKQTGQRCVFT